MARVITVLAEGTEDVGGRVHEVLFAGGSFNTAGGVAANGIAKWDGTAAGRLARWNGTKWSAPGRSVNDAVRALHTLGTGVGSRLFVGGDFVASPSRDSFVASWGCTQLIVPSTP